MKTKFTSGFTLIEVMISNTILGTVAAGVASVTLHTTQVALTNVHETTAHMVAQGYAEQIKAIHYGSIKKALDNPSEYTIPTESLRLGSADISEGLNLDDPLTFGVPVSKEVVIDVEQLDDGRLKEKCMKMEFTVNGRDMKTSTACWDAIEIAITFNWEYEYRGNTVIKESEVKIVKTNVTEY